MEKKAAQSRMDQEPTVTSKSSGMEYVKASISPSQGLQSPRPDSTKNDKS